MIASGYLRSLRTLEGLDVPPATPNAMDDEFDDESFDTGKWTWLDQGGATASESDGRLTIRLTETLNRIRGIYQSTPSGDWTIQAKLHFPIGSNIPASTLFCAESTTGDVRSVGVRDGNSVHSISHTAPSSSGAADGTQVTFSTGVSLPLPWLYAELRWDDTNLLLHGRVSFNGVVWHQIRTGGALVYTPAIVGLGFTNRNNLETIYPYGWFRRVA
jgi:hypothetical protein